jgi:histidinol-phosphate aminotransferase
MKIFVPDHIMSLKPYVPGKPLEEIQREYGITDAIKLASNENPLGPSPLAVEAIEKSAQELHRYPNGGGYDLIAAIAARLEVERDNVVLGNGSDDIIVMLARVLLQPGDEAILPQPSFLMYDLAVRACGATPVGIPLKSYGIDLAGMLEHIGPATRLVFVNNPHNPTGALISRTALESFIDALPPDIVLVIDEAYIEFVREENCPSSIEYLGLDKIIIGLRTFSKAYGLAGLRIGYGVMPAVFAEIINRIRQPFNVNSLAQAAAAAALSDEGFLENTVQLVHKELDFLYAALDALGIDYVKSQANFILIKVEKNADEVFENLLRQGVIVRSMTSYGYPDCIRVNVGMHDENVRFLAALRKVL